MNTDDLGNLRILNWLFKPAGFMMGSRLRGWLMDPVRALQGTYIEPGQNVLEVGCGTGFFTLPAARLIGSQGRLTAMDVLSDYVDCVSKKVQAAELDNVQVTKRDALDTGLEDNCIDTALLFGVIPFPSLPLNRLLPEMRRVLKPEGTLAIEDRMKGRVPESELAELRGNIEVLAAEIGSAKKKIIERLSAFVAEKGFSKTPDDKLRLIRNFYLIITSCIETLDARFVEV